APSVMLVRLLHADLFTLREPGAGGGALLSALWHPTQGAASPGRDHRRHTEVCEAATDQSGACGAPVDRTRVGALVCRRAGQRPGVLHRDSGTARDRHRARSDGGRSRARNSAGPWWPGIVGLLRVRRVPYGAKAHATAD